VVEEKFELVGIGIGKKVGSEGRAVTFGSF